MAREQGLASGTTAVTGVADGLGRLVTQTLRKEVGFPLTVLGDSFKV